MSFERLSATHGSVPLLSIPTVVLDTETTGLDPATDRVVQVGAVRLKGNQIDRHDTFDVLINPQVPIPASSTAIHGIGDQDVVAAADFTAALTKFAAWTGPALVVGYAIGFDLSVLRAEHARNGTTWQGPRSLDVRDLIQVIAPDLPQASLEVAADWLGVEIKDRHRALGDAIATAEIYRALIPRLAKAGIVTLAQAERASLRGGNTQRAKAGAAGWDEVIAEDDLVPASVSDYARIDSFPYRHRIADIMNRPARILPNGTSLADALAVMMQEQVSSVFLGPDQHNKDHGILTERDVLRAIAAQAANALTAPAAHHASRPLRSIGQSEFVYRAIVEMSVRGTRHLAVHDDAGQIVGALSARDLLKQRASDAISLGDSIARAETAAELGRVWAELVTVARGLVYEDVDPRDIAAIISRELRELTKRACEIAERELAAEGLVQPDVPYVMLVLGSGGRGESLLAMDQDNAIVYASDTGGDAADAWFERLGGRVADILDSVGVSYCKGGVMARNAAWRKSRERWRHTVSEWIARAQAEDILNSDIFFDCRPVYGEDALGEELRATAMDEAAAARNFQRTLASNAAQFDSLVGLFGRFLLTDGRMDLKKGGLFPIVATARVLALRHNIPDRSTPGRLHAAKQHMPEQAHVAEALIEAHKILLGTVLRQQLRDLDRGLALSNAVRPGELTKHQTQELRWALEQVPEVPNLLGTPLFAV